MSTGMDFKAMTTPVTKALARMNWPASKHEVIEHVRQNFPDRNGGPDKDKVIRHLEMNLTDNRSYSSNAEVLKSLREVQS